MTDPTPTSANPPSSGAGAGEASPKRALSARALAAQTVTAHARRFPDLIPAEPDTAGLDPRDAALAHAIVDRTVRHWLTISRILDARLKRPLAKSDPRLAGALMTGAAQLLLFDRLPDHAVVDESVELAKRSSKSAAGVVNAVLRKVIDLAGDIAEGPWAAHRDAIPLPDGRLRLLTAEELPRDRLERLAMATSTPLGLVSSWADRFGPAHAHEQALHSITQPPTVLNIAHSNDTSGLPLEAHSKPGHAVWTGERSELGAALDAIPGLWVQDSSSSGAVLSAADLRPSVVVDMCAGVGTKTRQLAATFPGARVIATDRDKDRLNTLRRATAHLPNVTVVKIESLVLDHAGTADLVLLDVPCSNLGVLARRVEAKYRVGAKVGREQLDRLRATQRQIVADSIPLLSPKGAILYATCSIDARENEGVAQWAGKWHGLKPQRTRNELPHGEPGGPASEYRDGAFSTLLTLGG